MKLVGICRVFKLEEVSEKCAKGQIYFSVDEVRKLKNAKNSIVAEMNEKKKVFYFLKGTEPSYGKADFEAVFREDNEVVVER